MPINESIRRSSIRPRLFPHLFAFATASGLAILNAQPVAPAGSAPEGGTATTTPPTEVVELSPFLVNSEQETGWVATRTLAGSRLNTEIKDLAAPIEVLTMEFMDEFGLSSIDEAAIYTTSLEGSGDNLELGPGLGFSTGFPPTSRIRGLTGVNRSRDFFGTSLNSDNYNLDRVTIASGPNNLLFGTGSPAGTVDSSLKRARFREFGKVETRFDSHGSQRYAIDLNKDLIKDKLALRVAALHEEKEYEYKPSGTDTQRLYGTLEFRPWRKTSISVHYEDASIDNIRPSLLLPFDQISNWYEASRSGFSASTVDRPLYDNPAVNLGGNNLGFNNASINNTVFQRENNQPRLIVGPNSGGLDGQVYNLNNTVTIKNPKDNPTVNALNREADGFTILDGTYFPIDKEMAGLSKLERIDAKIGNIFINQQIGDNLFLEFAAQKEEFTSWNAGMYGYIAAYTVKVDANRFLADGTTPNPNAGKLYVDGSGFRAQREVESDDWRFAASYELDFERNGKDSWWRNLLGKQRVAGLASGNRSSNVFAEYFPRILPEGGMGGAEPEFYGANLLQPYATNGTPNNGWANNATRELNFRYYLDPAAGDFSPRLNQDLFGPITYQDANGRTFAIDMRNTGLVDAEGRRLGAARSNASKNKLDTQQLSYQGFFWGNRLVATMGWRKDTINSARLTPGAISADQFTGLRPVLEDITFQSYNDDDEESGTTRTLGFVARPLTGLVKLPLDADISVTYNESNTFQPDTNLFGPFGNRVPGARGEGEDKGIRLDLMKGKFSLTYTEFENTAGPARAGNVPFNRFRFELSGPLNRVMNLAFGSNNTPISGFTENGGFNSLGNGDPYGVTSFQRAEGKEWTLNWNVTRNFTVRFNMNKQQVTESNIGTEWWAWLASELPKYQALTYPEGGVNNPRDLNGNGTIDTWTWDTAWRADGNQQTLADWYDTVVVRGPNGIDIIQSLDGRPNEFVRENRFNVNWVYRFDQGRLKGLSIGGAYRYREGGIIGLGSVDINGRESLDVDNAYYGQDDKFWDLSLNYRGKLDLWRFKGYRVGLNIRNLLNEDDPFARLVDVTGSPRRMSRQFEGRTFVFDLSLDL
jgi:hypothetical protein